MKKYEFKEIKNIIEKRDGVLLISTEYKNIFSKLLLRCKNNHLFNMSFSNFYYRNGGCPECKKLKRRSYDEIKQIIESEKGYSLISNEFKNVDSNIEIKCEIGHLYKARFSSFKDGQRCPICRKSKGEKMIREYLLKNNIQFEQEKKFKDLKSPKNRSLEYDFYIDELNLVIEFHGQQHYERVKCYDKTEEIFEYRKLLDKIKFDYCVKNNIDYICIPYTNRDKIEEILSEKIK